MANFYDTALEDPFGSALLFSLDKLDSTEHDFSVDTRIDIYTDQQSKQEYLPLIYFKNRWLEDQLEVQTMQLYKDDKQVTSAVIVTGRQK